MDAEDQILLSREVSHHVLRVLRYQPGDRVTLTDGQGAAATGVIGRIVGKQAEVAVDDRRTAPPDPLPRITLLYGLAKGVRTEWVLQKATEMGATRIVPTICERSVVRLRDAKAKQERWKEVIKQAARQSERYYLPALDAAASYREALALVKEVPLRIVACPDGKPLGQIVSPSKENLSEIAVLVGPEGGLASAEEQAAAAEGFQRAGMGPWILRSETAAFAALALVNHCSGRWD